MKEKVKQKLQEFLQEFYPEVILLFGERGALVQYLDDRVALVERLIDQLSANRYEEDLIAEIAVGEITANFGPSKYHYLLEVLLTEFPVEYQALKDKGQLKYEVTNLIILCLPAFDAFNFSAQTIQDRYLRHMIIAELHDYLV